MAQYDGDGRTPKPVDLGSLDGAMPRLRGEGLIEEAKRLYTKPLNQM
jgi:hypothetical protein